MYVVYIFIEIICNKVNDRAEPLKGVVFTSKISLTFIDIHSHSVVSCYLLGFIVKLLYVHGPSREKEFLLRVERRDDLSAHSSRRAAAATFVTRLVCAPIRHHSPL